jgi:hypothetical protein
MAFMTLALGMVDLGVGTFQKHVVAEASRQGARIASVHGSLAPSSMGVWGPTTYSGLANSGDTIPAAFSSAGVFTGLNRANVTVAVSWPSNSNSVQKGDTVQVTVSTTWTPAFSFIFGSSANTLSATSIMPIAH